MPVPTIDAGQAGQAGIVPPVVPTCRPVVSMIDAGKPVIDLASAGASPRPCPCRRSTRGKLTPGKLVIVSPVVPTCRGHRPGNVPRSPWCRRSTPGSVPSPGKLVIDLASAGAFPRPCPCRRSTPGKLGKAVIVPRSSAWQRRASLCRVSPVVPMIDAGQFQGKLTAGKAVIVPCPWCRRSTPGSVPSPGKLVIDLAVPGPSRGRARADDRRRPFPRAS